MAGNKNAGDTSGIFIFTWLWFVSTRTKVYRYKFIWLPGGNIFLGTQCKGQLNAQRFLRLQK